MNHVETLWVECVFMGAIGYNAPMIMFIHALTTPLFSMTPLITIKGAIKKHTTNLPRWHNYGRNLSA